MPKKTQSHEDELFYSNLVPPKKRVLQQGQQRPDFPGNNGQACQLRVNHFRMKVPKGQIYQYSLTIVPPWERPYKKADMDIYHLGKMKD